MSTIHIEIFKVEEFTNSAGESKALVILNVTNGFFSGFYEAVSDIGTFGKPTIVFNMNNLTIQLATGNPFHLPFSSFSYPLVNGQKYSLINNSAVNGHFVPVLFGILSGTSLVNSRVDSGVQTGDVTLASNYLTLGRFDQISFTLDTSVTFPTLITISETTVITPPLGCCAGIECETPA